MAVHLTAHVIPKYNLHRDLQDREALTLGVELQTDLPYRGTLYKRVLNVLLSNVDAHFGLTVNALRVVCQY